MVAIVTIGVLSLQGAVSEHLASMNRVLKEEKQPGQAILVRQPHDIDACDALIIPGGENTTISRILVNSGMHDAIRQRMKQNNIALMGTCAGCVILAKELTDTNADVRPVTGNGYAGRTKRVRQTKRILRKTCEG